MSEDRFIKRIKELENLLGYEEFRLATLYINSKNRKKDLEEIEEKKKLIASIITSIKLNKSIT